MIHLGAASRWPSEAAIDEFGDSGPLDSYRPRCLRDVLQSHRTLRFAGRPLFLKPLNILQNARSINDEQVLLFVEAVSIQIVDYTSGLIAHECVLSVARRQLPDIICQQAVQEPRGAGPADQHLAHVRNIEQASGLTHGQMFVHDAGVLHRHFPAAEFD